MSQLRTKKYKSSFTPVEMEIIAVMKKHEKYKQ